MTYTNGRDHIRLDQILEQRSSRRKWQRKNKCLSRRSLMEKRQKCRFKSLLYPIYPPRIVRSLRTTTIEISSKNSSKHLSALRKRKHYSWLAYGHTSVATRETLPIIRKIFNIYLQGWWCPIKGLHIPESIGWMEECITNSHPTE